MTSEVEKGQWEDRFQTVQVRKQTILERTVLASQQGAGRLSVETACSPVEYILKTGEVIEAVLVVHWPVDVKSQLEVCFAPLLAALVSALREAGFTALPRAPTPRGFK